MSTVLTVLAALAFGVGSALVPVLNAEAYAVVAAWRVPVVPLVVALAVGQTAGKLVLLECARRGAARYLARLESSRWGARVTRSLASRRTGGPLVLASAAVGMPPLAVVSIAAGAAGMPAGRFTPLCLVGRLARFAAIVGPVAWVVWTA